MMPKRHNPDFAIHYPPFAGVWVELKGNLRDPLWFPMLRNYPEWMKKVYKVVLVNKSRIEREKYRKTLEKIGIEVSDFVIPVSWCEQAVRLYLQNSDKTFELLGPDQSPLAHWTVDSETTYREVE